MIHSLRSLCKQVAGQGPLVLLIMMLSLSLSLNVALGWRLGGVSSPRNRGGVLVGSVMGTISVIDASGKMTELRFAADREILLYVFSPQCSWCTRNDDNIVALARALHGRVDVVGLSNVHEGNAQRRFGSTSVPFPVYAVTTKEQIAALRLDGTPQTVLVSRGRVIRVWVGAYDLRTQQEVENYFAVRLPGLRQTPIERRPPEGVGVDTIAR